MRDHDHETNSVEAAAAFERHRNHGMRGDYSNAEEMQRQIDVYGDVFTDADGKVQPRPDGRELFERNAHVDNHGNVVSNRRETLPQRIERLRDVRPTQLAFGPHHGVVIPFAVNGDKTTLVITDNDGRGGDLYRLREAYPNVFVLQYQGRATVMR